MDLKKLFIMLSMALLLLTSIVIDFNASEVNVTSKTKGEQSYAPVNPTAEEIEAVADTDLVVFKDNNLKKELSDILGVASDEITVGHMKSLTSLNLERGEDGLISGGIEDLTGLEYAINLTSLNLKQNPLKSWAPISGLTNLTHLNLENVLGAEFDHLLGLTNLTYLNLNGHYNEDLLFLSGLTNLTHLEFRGYSSATLNVDISPLKSLTNLTHLSLDNNALEDISALSGLTNLTYLDLSETYYISDVSALSGLTNLTYLDLSSSFNLIDISALSGLTNLTYLNLNSCAIDDISALSGLTNLTYLELSSNSIDDISALSGLTNLTHLNVGYQYISPDDIIVYNDDEIFYTIIDIDGSEHQISLGVPSRKGRNHMYGDWHIDIDEARELYFSGYIYQVVMYESLPPLTGNDTATTTEETILTDEELINLFDVVSNYGKTITVNQSVVDYSTPGDYETIFTDTDGNEFIGTLTITDVLPTLDINQDSVTIKIGKTLEDILSLLDYAATEIIAGDLTDIISIDDSSVDYSTAGNYDIIFTVIDEEGNSITKTITVTVDDSIDVVEPETPDVTTPDEETTDEVNDDEVTEETTDEVTEETTDEVNDENAEDVTDSDSSVSLATTGGNETLGTIIALFATIIVVLTLKKVVKE